MIAELTLAALIAVPAASGLHDSGNVHIPRCHETVYETVTYTFPEEVTNVRAYALEIGGGAAWSATNTHPGRTFTLKIPYSGHAGDGIYIATVLGKEITVQDLPSPKTLVSPSWTYKVTSGCDTSKS